MLKLQMFKKKPIWFSFKFLGLYLPLYSSIHGSSRLYQLPFFIFFGHHTNQICIVGSINLFKYIYLYYLSLLSTYDHANTYIQMNISFLLRSFSWTYMFLQSLTFFFTSLRFSEPPPRNISGVHVRYNITSENVKLVFVKPLYG